MISSVTYTVYCAALNATWTAETSDRAGALADAATFLKASSRSTATKMPILLDCWLRDEGERSMTKSRMMTIPMKRYSCLHSTACHCLLHLTHVGGAVS